MIPPSEVRVAKIVGRPTILSVARPAGLVPGGRDAGGEADTTGRSEKKEISVQPMRALRRLLRARGRYRPRAKRGPDVTGARPGQSPTKGPLTNQHATSRNPAEP